MIKKAVKKLWKGEYVSVRDYEVLDAINGDIMKLTPDQLKDLEPQENVFKSQFNSGTYRLVDIFWKPQ